MKTCATLFALALCLLTPARARAAQSYDNCTGFIDALPASIGTQGTWCLRGDLATAMTSGAAIAITTNNVTLDCNGFKLGGLAAGAGTSAYGVSSSQHNVTVRNCAIRGFMAGIVLSGGSGHLVEDNRLDNMTYIGMIVGGDGALVRRNRVLDTGGRTGSSLSTGMSVNGDVVDNIVDGVFALVASTTTTGIAVTAPGARVRGNTVRGLVVSAGGGTAVGINLQGAEMQVEDNNVISTADINGIGLFGDTGVVCTGNKVFNFASPMPGCTDGGGNNVH